MTALSFQYRPTSITKLYIYIYIYVLCIVHNPLEILDSLDVVVQSLYDDPELLVSLTVIHS